MKKLTKKSSELVVMLHQLEPILSHRNRIGYVAARNFRILSDTLIEYDRFKMELVEKYGEPDKAKDGTALPTVSIKVGSPEFKSFCDEMAPYNNMEHEVDIMTAKFEDVVDVLNGEEIVAIDWMLED